MLQLVHMAPLLGMPLPPDSPKFCCLSRLNSGISPWRKVSLITQIGLSTLSAWPWLALGVYESVFLLKLPEDLAYLIHPSIPSSSQSAIWPSIHTSIQPSIHPTIHPSNHHPFIHPTIHLSIHHPFNHPSIHPSNNNGSRAYVQPGTRTRTINKTEVAALRQLTVQQWKQYVTTTPHPAPHTHSSCQCEL